MTKPWLRPLIVAIVLVALWSAVTIPGLDGEGLAVWQFVIIAAATVAVMTWCGTSWTRRRRAGRSMGSQILRALWQGALVGAALGLITFVVAQFVADAPNYLGILVIVPWAVIGSVVFVIFAVLVLVGVRPARGISLSG